MNQVSFYALYSDGRKCQAVLEGDQTFLRTDDGGKMPVPLRIENGEFVKFGFDYSPEPRLRAGDVGENFGRFARYVSRMTPPAKSSAPPIPQAEPDPRVHLEERLPGESRLSQLQRSFGAGVMQARLERQQTHHNQSAESIGESERRDAAKVAAARRFANDALHARQRPNYGASGPPEKK